MSDKTCIDCGRPSHGLRCRECHGKAELARALATTAERDRRLLALAEEKPRLSQARIGLRMGGLSAVRVGQLLRKARTREALRRGETLIEET